MVCTARPLPLDHSMTAAQGPQGQTNLTVVLVAHSGAPGRPRTPDSKQAHRHRGKTSALRATPESSTPFQDPRGSATALRELKAVLARLLSATSRPVNWPAGKTARRKVLLVVSSPGAVAVGRVLAGVRVVSFKIVPTGDSHRSTSTWTERRTAWNPQTRLGPASTPHARREPPKSS